MAVFIRGHLLVGRGQRRNALMLAGARTNLTTYFASTRFVFSWRKTLITLPILALLLALGTWQVQRLVWKENLVTQIAARQSMVLPVYMKGAPENLDYQRVMLGGMIDSSKSVLLAPRTLNGIVGAHMLQPFLLPDGTALVANLGFVPQGFEVPQSKAEQFQVLSGTLRIPDTSGWMKPENNLAKGEFYWLDITALAQHWQMELEPVVLELDQIGDAPPIGGITRLDVPNNHAQYALTWFLLFLIILGLYALASREKI